MGLIGWITGHDRKPEAKAKSLSQGQMVSLPAMGVGSMARPENKAAGRVAEEMRRDYQVQFSERTIRSVAKMVPVIATHDAPGDIRADALAAQLTALFQRNLRRMFDAVGDGRVAFEKFEAYDRQNNLSIVRKLASLPYQQTDMILAADGAFEGIRLKPKGGDAVLIPPDKSWWLALDPTVMEPHGRSQYLGAPEDAWEKRRNTIRLRDLIVRRFVIQRTLARIPPTYTDPETQQIVDNFKLFAEQWLQCESGGLIMAPNGESDGKPDYDLEPIEAADPTPLNSILQAQEVEQLRSFGLPEGAMQKAAGQSGSYAEKSIDVLMLFALVEDYLDEFTGSFDKYVVQKCVEKNWPEGQRPAFTMTFKRITDAMLAEQLTAAAERPAATLGTPGAKPGEPVPTPAATGEFAGLSRQQLIRNLKAIDDVLNKLTSGEYTEQRARTMLSALGLAAETIDGLLTESPSTPPEE